MSIGQYRYLAEKLGTAVHVMLVPRDNARAIGDAMHEITLACADLRIGEDEQAERWRRHLMDRAEAGEGSWEDKAAAMSPDEQREFATAAWELWAWAQRMFWNS